MKQTTNPLIVLTGMAAAVAFVFTLSNPINAAEKSGGVNVAGRAAPIATVAEFDKVFTQQLNTQLGNEKRWRGTVYFDHIKTEDKIDRKVFIISAKGKAGGKAELEQLRNDISAGLKKAATGGVSLGSIAEGSIGDNFFAGRITTGDKK